MVAIIGNEYTAQIIITMLKQWDDALCSLELQQIIPFYEQRSTYYDLSQEFHHLKQYQEFWQQFRLDVPSTPQQFHVLRRRMTVYADENMVTFNSFFRITSMVESTHPNFGWCRQTMCWIKVDEQWKIVHQHISAPIDLDTGTLKKIEFPLSIVDES